jgi:uncharacterized protein (UPF0332 family)
MGLICETGDRRYLAKARECLDAAIKINTFPLPQVAAKEAYLAAYHAARAFIFERTGKVVKSDGGMRAMFALVAKDDPRIDRSLGAVLGRAYGEPRRGCAGAFTGFQPPGSAFIIRA